MSKELIDKINRMEELIQLLRRDIDKFRTDFFEIRNKVDSIEINTSKQKRVSFLRKIMIKINNWRKK